MSSPEQDAEMIKLHTGIMNDAMLIASVCKTQEQVRKAISEFENAFLHYHDGNYSFSDEEHEFLFKKLCKSDHSGFSISFVYSYSLHFVELVSLMATNNIGPARLTEVVPVIH